MYRWIIPLAVVWPMVAIGATLAVFGPPPRGALQLIGGAIGFLLVGVFSGWGLIYSLSQADALREQLAIVLFYLLVSPLAYALGIGAPFAIEAMPGVVLPPAVTYLVVFPIVVGLNGSLLLLGAIATGRWVGLYISRAI
ncbi:MAG: hypothetical protein HYX92_08620 [Chloroflexi bacterium]|nr:hypothetical protein [Chloroflexota bacterium]